MHSDERSQSQSSPLERPAQWSLYAEAERFCSPKRGELTRTSWLLRNPLNVFPRDQCDAVILQRLLEFRAVHDIEVTLTPR